MADTIRYINTASVGGDGTTNNTTGATAAYASFIAWNTAEATTVSTGNRHIVYCTGGQDDITNGGSGVSMSGWSIADTDGLQIICTDTRTPGAGIADGYRLYGARSSGTVWLLHPPNRSYWENLYIHYVGSGTNAVNVFQLKNITYNSLNVKRGYIYIASIGDTSAVQTGVGIQSSTAGSAAFEDFIFEGPGPTAGTLTAGLTGNYGTISITLKQCISTAWARGSRTYGETFAWTNSASFNNNSGDFVATSGTNSATYCASDDVYGTNAIDISPGATESTDWASAFTDYTTHDFRVKDASSVLYQAGTNSGVSNDFFGTSWGGVYDVGAIKYVAGGGSIPIFAHHLNHNIGSNL